MTLDEAIAELKEMTCGQDWTEHDMRDKLEPHRFSVDQAIAVILNAVVSGELKK